jgi:AraC-like DNA-binding protein
MLNEPTVLAVTAIALKEALEARGLDPVALAERAGLDLDLMAQPGARYRSARMQAFWKLAAQESDDRLLGLHVGEYYRPTMLHALGMGIISSTTLLDALYRIERYGRVVSTNGRLVVVEGPQITRLEARATEQFIAPTMQARDAAVLCFLRMLKLCAGPIGVPLKVKLPHDGHGHPETFREVFGCPVDFDSPPISFIYETAKTKEPVHSGSTELAAEADRMAARYLGMREPQSAAMRVRSLLLRKMPSGSVTQEDIARALHQSTSTLQRRLRQEGTSYQSLLDEIRRELALDYLRDGKHSIADVAFLLGFSDQSNFTRAFRRWTGTTPRQVLS